MEYNGEEYSKFDGGGGRENDIFWIAGGATYANSGHEKPVKDLKYLCHIVPMYARGGPTKVKDLQFLCWIDPIFEDW